MDLENAEQVLEDVSVAVGLEEGPEGIRKILRFVCRFEPVPLHALARAVMIPVPVASAARRELEKRNICSRKSGNESIHAPKPTRFKGRTCVVSLSACFYPSLDGISDRSRA